jgi:hypothetical protein
VPAYYGKSSIMALHGGITLGAHLFEIMQVILLSIIFLATYRYR